MTELNKPRPRALTWLNWMRKLLVALARAKALPIAVILCNTNWTILNKTQLDQIDQNYPECQLPPESSTPATSVEELAAAKIPLRAGALVDTRMLPCRQHATQPSRPG